jgi:hypothetical protein
VGLHLGYGWFFAPRLIDSWQSATKIWPGHDAEFIRADRTLFAYSD